MGEIISGKRRIASAALDERAARAASGLKSVGVGRGDLIAIYLRNDFAFFEASFAAGLIGAYPTPVNWHYAPDEARYLFENSGARAIIIHADLVEPIRHVFPDGVPVFVVPTPPEVAAAYGVPLEGFEPYGGPPEAAPGTIIYTSGTTGHPKGVRREPPTPEQAATYGRVVLGVMGFDGRAGAPADIVTVVTGPMYHSAPNAYGGLGVRSGAKVILEPRFDPEGLLAMIEREKVTHLHMVPIMFTRLLKLPDAVKAKYDLSSLRFVVHAAAPCP